MHYDKVISWMTTTGDTARVYSEAVSVPTWAETIGVSIPPLDAASAVYIQIGDSVDRAFDLNDPYLVEYFDFNFSDGLVGRKAGYTLAVNGNPTADDSVQDGSGIKLDGTGDFLKSDTATEMNLTTGDFSIMAVAKIPATASKAVIAAKRNGTAGDGVGYEVGIAASTSVPYITLEDANSTTTTSSTAGTAVDTGYVVMLHWTVDRSESDGYKIYINGAATGSSEDCSGEASTITSTSYLTLGCDSATTPGNLLTGTLLRYAMWSNVRTAQKIATDYYGGFYDLNDPSDGQPLVVAASGYTPTFFDLTPYAASARGRTIRVRCGTLQTATNNLPFVFHFAG